MQYQNRGATGSRVPRQYRKIGNRKHAQVQSYQQAKIPDPNSIPETVTHQTPEVGLTSHHWYLLVPVYQGHNQLAIIITVSYSR
jgi:hypothetical protein